MDIYQFKFDISCEGTKRDTTKTLLLCGENYDQALDKVRDHIKSRKKYTNDLSMYNISIQTINSSFRAGL